MSVIKTQPTVLTMEPKVIDTLIDDVSYLNDSMLKKLRENSMSDSVIQTYLVCASRIVHELSVEANRRKLINS